MRLVVLLSVYFVVLPGLAQAADEGVEFFEQKIRPVLVQQCYSCHSVSAKESKKLKGGLYLDSAAGLLAGGETGPAIVKGKPTESLLIKALKFDGLEMPPTGRLGEAVVADFVKWIESGAPDPRDGSAPVKPKREINIAEGRQWWSFQPLRAAQPPAPLAGSPATNIDRFLMAARQQNGVTENGPATKSQLLRRVYFDLIGLPPTPEQVEAFVNDGSAQAFENVVNGLLNSPQYGEKWARHWLDVARYAESGGYEFDGFRPGAYHYRDWVIRALNNDMPYNEFVRLQLAGEKVSPEDYQAAEASGFLMAGPFPGQITAKTVERIRYDQLDDMLMTIGGSMLGLTLGCVRCHDHKYDPLRQQDYYALAANFATASHGSRYFDPDPAATEVAFAKHQADHEQLVAASRAFAMTELPPRFETWKNTVLPQQPDAPRWQVLEPVEFAGERVWLKSLPGGVVAADGDIPVGTKLNRAGESRPVRGEERQRLVYRTHQKQIQAVRLDALTDKALPSRGPGLNGDGSFQLVELKITAKPLDPAVKDAPQELKLKPVFAAFEDPDNPLKNAVDNQPATAWVVRATARKDNAAVFELEAPLAGFPGGTELVWELQFRDQGLGRLRCAISTEANPATWAGDFAPQHLGEIRALLAANGNALPEPLRPEMSRWFAAFDEPTGRLIVQERTHAALKPRPPITEVYTTIPGGQDVFLLRRGEVDSKLGKADPGVIQVLLRTDPSAGAAPAPEPRVKLADWMTDVDQGAGPLLARVMVNRLWQHHFGEGIVGTPNDFGAQGERPSHPELLEYLASEFVRGGWRLKPLHRQIVMSAAYQQSPEIKPENVARDPDNRLLWHYQPRRLEAESIRDQLLVIGGNLEPTMYGPSVLDNSPRRSVYLRVKRSELIPLMTMFDAPEPTQSIGERVTTTVPTQALAMMNSPFVQQQAERLTQRMRTIDPQLGAAAIDKAYQIAFARLPSEAERQRMAAYIEQQRPAFGGDQTKAFAEFCQVLLCLNEFVYID